MLELLGSGGMGEVYRARDPVLKREVAIKVIPPYFARDSDRLQRFEQEAQAAAALNHLNILAIYHFGACDGSPYLVSELLVGETLRQLLEHGPLTLRKAIEYGVQFAHGLAAAHDKAIVHRDLKPDNLFVTKDGHVKILDFGLAKLVQRGSQNEGSDPTVTRRTEPGMALGTAGYMSPEQVRGIAVDHRSDIFAFGAILYEALTGSRAFQRPTSAETMTAILNDSPPPVSQCTPGVPPTLQRVIHRCLEKNPEQRFQSASDLAFALEASSDSGGLSGGLSAASSGADASQRPSRPSLFVIAGLAALVVMVLPAAFVVLREERVPQLHVSAYTQLTQNGHVGAVVATDGSRLYLEKSIADPIEQVSVSGGEIEPVPSIGLPKPFLLDVSPDGSTFLLTAHAAGPSSAGPLYSVRILGGQQRYLGKAESAAWSPDGQSILYVSADGDLHRMRSDGGDDRRLIHPEGDLSSLAWSPDQKTIRYTVNNAFFELSADGSNLHPLFPGWRSSHANYCVGWSPDGAFFFATSGGQIWARDERHWLLRHAPAEMLQLTSGPIRYSNPIVSRDGKKIFATGYTLRGELSRFDPHSGQFQPFLGGLSADLLSYSRDRHAVAWANYPDDIVWIANADGSQRVQLTNASFYPESLSLSPNGKQVLFMSQSSTGRHEAWIVDTQGGSPHRLLPGNTIGQETDPNWSPDGSKIVFASGMLAETSRESFIRILDVATHQVSTLPGSAGMFSPHWSPDGRFILASSLNVSTFYLFDTRAQHWSTLYQGILGYAAWASDSRSVYGFRYTDDPAVLHIPINGGKVQTVASLKDFQYTGTLGLWFGLDPTDAPLMLRDVGTSDVYALDLERK